MVVTLIFAPMAKNHHWFFKLAGKRYSTKSVLCAPAPAPCPARKTVYKRVYLPKPRTVKPKPKPQAKLKPEASKPKPAARKIVVANVAFRKPKP